MTAGERIVSPRGHALLLATPLAVFTGLSFWAMSEESVTYDEGVHLSAGYTALTERDYRMNPEHPPLGKILAALPLLAVDVRLPPDPEHWRHASQWTFGYRFLFQSGNDPERLLFLGRLSTLFWGLVLILAVYAASADVFGRAAGLLSAWCAGFCPLLLGHGHLVTTDVVVAALTLLSLLAFRELARAPSLGRAAAAGILLGGAMAAKFSAVFLAPVAAWIAVSRWIRGRERVDGRAAVGVLARGIVLGLACWATLWGVYGFRYASSTDGARNYTVIAAPDAPLSTRVLAWAAEHGALPGAFLHGFALASEHSSTGHPAYALGAHSETGWRWYFPFAFLVKTPLCALALYAGGAALAFARSRERPGALDFVVIPLIFYAVLAMGSRLNIGLRHVLPLFPFLMILAGAWLAEGASARRARWAVGLALGLALETAAAAPNHLAHFNLAARLAAEPHRLLADSNLDWGQDLRRLKRYAEREGIRDLKLAYFGAASPKAEGLSHSALPGRNLYSWHQEGWPAAALPLKAGDVVAVSASVLVGLMMEDKELYARYFRGKTPLARLGGGAILVYRVE